MKRFIAITLVLAALLAVILTGCNYKMIDITYKFDRAILKLPDGTIVSGKLESWRDYEDSDAIQIRIDDTTYYTFLSNVVLIHEETEE